MWNILYLFISYFQPIVNIHGRHATVQICLITSYISLNTFYTYAYRCKTERYQIERNARFKYLMLKAFSRGPLCLK